MTVSSRPVTTADAERIHSKRAVTEASPTRNNVLKSRIAARIIGVLILAGWFTYGPGGAITNSIVTASDVATNVTTNRTIFTFGAVVMLLNSAAVVAIGVLWFPVLKRHSERVALSYLATRILEGAFLAVGIISLLALIGLDEAAGSTASAPHVQTLAAVAVDVNDLAYQTGMATLGVGSLFLCSLLFRSELVPRVLAAWGVVGYGIFAVGMVLDMFGLGVGTLLTIPGGMFELAFAAWLIAKGINPAAPTSPGVATRELATR